MERIPVRYSHLHRPFTVSSFTTALTVPINKLDAAIKSLEKGQKNAAINQINPFINEVNAQRGKKLTDEQADCLVGKAKYIIDVINL